MLLLYKPQFSLVVTLDFYNKAKVVSSIVARVSMHMVIVTRTKIAIVCRRPLCFLNYA
jgi:hypothetical protein